MSKILIVDDDQEVLTILEKRLKQEDFEVIAAATGEEAIQKAKGELPNLILMDIILPDIDGAEAVSVLKKDSDTKNIPVIFLSGIVKDERQGKRDAFEVNVCGRKYNAIPKPFSFGRLMDEIKEAMEA